VWWGLRLVVGCVVGGGELCVWWGIECVERGEMVVQEIGGGE
jgi:hypothetical protein